ncbi:hypothetical protein VKT23_009435 [Stygiomarasmius scandens]|uniref:Uncharacterized protein n=1 Tax=Marasmiellus scandens TaxID=2682957 RepID=A0ABR1JDR6_9AGAR
MDGCIGYGGISIWDLATSAAVSAPHLPYEPHNRQHVYVSSTWMYFEGTDHHVFIVGNMSGQISLWYFDSAQKVFRAAGNQIVDKNGTSIVMAIDVSEPSVAPSHSGWIVTSTDDSTIAVWTLTSTFEITNVFKVDPPDGFIPRIVKFARSTRNVFSFSKRGGGLRNQQVLMLNRYAQAFVWHVETSLYPLGLAIQAFIFVPALSKFASAHTPSAATVTITKEASPVTVTIMEHVYDTITIIEVALTSSATSLTVTQTITESSPVTVTTTEKLLSIATVTESLTITAVPACSYSATVTSEQTMADLGLL